MFRPLVWTSVLPMRMTIYPALSFAYRRQLKEIELQTNKSSAIFDLANRFSVESYYNENPFGQHKCWNYQNDLNLKKLIKKFPIIKNLYN